MKLCNNNYWDKKLVIELTLAELQALLISYGAISYSKFKEESEEMFELLNFTDTFTSYKFDNMYNELQCIVKEEGGVVIE